MKALFLTIFFFAVPSFAQAPTQEIPLGDFLSQVLDAIKTMGGVPWVLKIAAIIMIVISSMKVSVLNQLFWSKIGGLQSWIAPLLGLIAGILNLAKEGKISLPAVIAYVSAGAGAIILYELLDSIKAIPGIGAKWVELIGVIESFLGKKKEETPK